MASKYKRTPAKPKQSNTTKPMEKTESTAPEEKNTHEQHKDFLKAAEDSVKPTNEPTLENFDNVTSFDNPTIERAYTSDGFKKADGASATEPTPNQPPTGDFEPTPPPPDDPDYVGTHEPKGDTNPGDPLKIPAGNAEELVKFGANALNFLIGNFVGKLVSVKIKPQYHSIKDNKTRAIDIIKEFNESSIEKIKLDDEDIAMLTPPLVKLLQEKGIRGLTPGEELMLAIAMIGAKKVKAIMEIRAESKRLENHFDSMIQYMRNDFKNDTTKEDITPPPADTEQEPIFTHAEEV